MSPENSDTGAAAAVVDTHCPYCALQCGMALVRRPSGFEVTARNFPTNQGGLCRKGWTSSELLSSPERLTTPLVRRRPGGLSPASWAEAIDFIASSFRGLAEQYGKSSIGVFGGGGLTNEKAYALGKFARVVLGSRHIDYNGRFCMSSAAVANQRVFGLDRGLPFPLADIPGADVVVLLGANPAETMPPIMRYFEALRARGGKLVVIDPRRTPTAAGADVFLQLVPGSDAALGNGLLHVVVRDKLVDQAFIAERTSGFAAAQRSALSYWPDRVERITGIPAADIVSTAQLLGRAKHVMLLSARGAEQQAHGVDNLLAFTNLLLALGQAGRRHTGYACLTGQGNGQGGREHGLKADQLPGYRKLSSDADRRHVAAAWGVAADDLPPPGLPALELFEALGKRGGVRALWVMGANPVVSAPNATRLEQQLSELDFLVVSDPFLSETAQLADVVLPAAQWAEEEGTTTNLEGRVLYRARATAPPPGVKTDLEAMHLVAEALGRADSIPSEPAAAFAELGRVSSGGKADYAGISYARIQREQGVFWPCPTPDAPGLSRPFEQRFWTSDGRARFFAVEHQGPSEVPDAEYPLYLTTGRLMLHYQSGSQTRRVPELLQAEPHARVDVHPETARGLGISEGEAVWVITRRGRARLCVRHNVNLRFDTLFVAFHFAGDERANLLTSGAVDPVSKIPEFKVAAARLERVEQALVQPD